MPQRWLAKELARRDPSLAAFWPMFGSFNDFSGRRHHLAKSGMGVVRTTAAAGRPGVWCSETNTSWLTSSFQSSDLDFDGTTKFTMSAWIWRDEGTNDVWIMAKNSGVNHTGYEFGVLSASGLMFSIYSNFTSGAAITVKSGDLGEFTQKGRWVHVAVAYNGSRVASGVKLFVNGRAVKPIVQTDNMAALTSSNSADLTVAWNPRTSANTAAPLSLLRVYKRALPSKEITNLYRREINFFRQPARMKPPTPTPISSSLSLYLSGSIALSSSTTLYVGGKISSSGGIPLDVIGIMGMDAPMPLFVQTDSPSVASEAITLNVVGSSQSGVTKGAPLFLECGDDGNVPTGSMNLFLNGSPVDWRTNAMNLAVEGCSHKSQGSLFLTAWNNQSGVTEGTTLFARGDGKTDGASPATGSMNLFMMRWPSQAIPLWVQGPGSPSSLGSPLYTLAANGWSSGVPLFESAIGGQSGSTKLFTSGY